MASTGTNGGDEMTVGWVIMEVGENVERLVKGRKFEMETGETFEDKQFRLAEELDLAWKGLLRAVIACEKHEIGSEDPEIEHVYDLPVNGSNEEILDHIEEVLSGGNQWCDVIDMYEKFILEEVKKA